MNTFLIILAFSCLLVGIIGAVSPGIPGPPVSWAGLLLSSFTPWAKSSLLLLVATAMLAVVITVLDYVIPALFTKRFGGTKYGVWGCSIGLLISFLGIFFGPQGLLGILFWPFLGAFAGEYIHRHALGPALLAACGTFFGFLAGTFLKVVYCVALLVVVIISLAFGS